MANQTHWQCNIYRRLNKVTFQIFYNILFTCRKNYTGKEETIFGNLTSSNLFEYNYKISIALKLLGYIIFVYMVWSCVRTFDYKID